ncbi:aminotransferase class V-fold PLP-dependent enzyme [Haloplanus salinus]|jgi:selenocysteine lyase/cysteine desulfurase|uniref:Aminotransferase class V-fold PLP-dependent enzyme n=1 Tax=Haloplanus salinus TaxID=1126245 RepID=A0A368NGH7_9EURY|nr:aminotransferase class V-fold PLP-dependent enzyme [Haloplanus salinus]RCU48501.1 aminotransferase class V-fold PLP-dependent enzyme [Haloplanus salinus]
MDPEDLRAAIPACDRGVYLNTGASGPAPRHVVDATADFLDHHEYVAPVEEGAYPAAFETFDETREVVADFLGADPQEIALTDSTADGIARVAAAIDWAPGDTVVRTDLEHSAGVIPWWNLRDRGVEVTVLDTEAGRVDLDALTDAVSDPDTRLLCCNSITWNYGTQLPISTIVDIAHEHDTLVLVDAVQSPGQVPVDVGEWGADFVAAAGHKWLLGPWGAGFLYVDREVADELTPGVVGYRSVADTGADDLELKPGAPRLEVGTTSPAPYHGLTAAIDTVEALGYDTVTGRIERLTDRLKEGLGDRLLSPHNYESGLVAFTADDPAGLVERLADEGVHVRSLPYPDAVRASVHVFNTAGDVDALLDAL